MLYYEIFVFIVILSC